MPAPTRVHREVTSYVRRSARMRPGQRAAYEAQAERFVVEVPRSETSTSVATDATPLDLAAVFRRTAPVVVEIGCGPGDSLVPMAAARPDVDVLAFEVYEPAVAGLLARVAREGVSNVAVVVADAAAGLARLVSADSIEEVWTFFPDPWPKAKHHKRRLVDPAFAAVVASRLRAGGRWWLATDWPDYAEQMVAVLDANPAFVAEPVNRRDRPVTRFEQRGIEAGRPIVDLAYRRVEP